MNEVMLLITCKSSHVDILVMQEFDIEMQFVTC